MAVLVWLFLMLCSHLPLCLSSCGPYGHNIASLVKPGYWWFELDDVTQCGPFPMNSLELTNNVSRTCNFFFSICSPVPVICYKDTVVCSFLGNVNTDDPVITWPMNFGSESTYDFEVKDNQGFEVTFTDGELCSGEKTWKTVMTFVCNESASWNTTINKHLKYGGAVSPKPTKLLIKECSVVMTFESDFACGPVPPGSASANLSIGSLLLILFIPSFFLYCIVGVLVNSHAGRRGKEVVPHSAFWFDLPDLIMDGFLFVMNCLTCRDACRSDPNRLYESI